MNGTGTLIGTINRGRTTTVPRKMGETTPTTDPTPVISINANNISGSKGVRTYGLTIDIVLITYLSTYYVCSHCYARTLMFDLVVIMCTKDLLRGLHA